MEKYFKCSTKKISFQIVALIIILICATVSWFIFNQFASASTMGMKMKQPINISISTDGDHYSDRLSITDGGNGVSVPVSEMSGNGKNLFKPIVHNFNTIVGYESITEVDEKCYIDFKVNLKADGPVKIYLSDDSEITPVDIDGNKSSYGEYSKDCIAGAVRVSFFSDAQDSKTIIWAPNTNYQFNKDSNSFEINGTVEPKYKYITGTNKDQDIRVIDTNGVSSGVSQDGCFLWGKISEIENKDLIQPITIIDTPKGTEMVKKIHVRLWIEGTDREAVKQFVGGKFKVKLNFISEVIDK